MSIGFKGIGDVVVTFKIAVSSQLDVGDVVAIKANGFAYRPDIDEEIIGVCVSKTGLYVGVQVKGGVEIPCDDKLTIGYCSLVSNENGEVTKGTTGASHLVCNITNRIASIIL